MALGATERAAWAAVLAARRGGKTLPVAVQTAFVDFFAANDLALTEYWPVDVKNVDWQDEWREFAMAAAVDAAWQVGAVLRWIENKSGAVVSSSHRADAVVQIIEAGGVTLLHPGGGQASSSSSTSSSSPRDPDSSRAAPSAPPSHSYWSSTARPSPALALTAPLHPTPHELPSPALAPAAAFYFDLAEALAPRAAESIVAQESYTPPTLQTQPPEAQQQQPSHHTQSRFGWGNTWGLAELRRWAPAPAVKRLLAPGSDGVNERKLRRGANGLSLPPPSPPLSPPALQAVLPSEASVDAPSGTGALLRALRGGWWCYGLIAAGLPTKLASGAWPALQASALILFAPLALLSITPSEPSKARDKRRIIEISICLCVCGPLVDAYLAALAGCAVAVAVHLWNASTLLLLLAGFAAGLLNPWHCLRVYLLCNGAAAMGSTLLAFSTGGGLYPAPGGVATDGMMPFWAGACELLLAATITRPAVRHRFYQLGFNTRPEVVTVTKPARAWHAPKERC